MHRRLALLVLAMGLCLGAATHAANIVLVNEAYDVDGNGIQDDLRLEEFLVGLGHQVDIQRGNWTTLDAAKIATLNAADLIVVSRSIGSGNYDDDSTEIANWNGLTAPLLLLTPYLSRGTSSNYRWYWVNSAAVNNLIGPMMRVVVPTHPIFKGIPLDASNLVDVVDGTTGTGQTSFAGTTDVGNGTLLATTATGGNSWIVEWQPGTPYYAGSPGTPGGKRMLFCCGTQESGATPQGAFNLTENGKKLFTNAINYMAGIEEVKTATDPVPADEATDVVRDIVLAWTPNAWAATHDVYFGTVSADVEAADRDNPTGVLAIEGQTTTAYQPPEPLTYGQTYYWRIDEVNAAPDSTIFKGDVWSFTVEPYSYVLANVTATASSSNVGMGPEKTVDGSGLSADGRHSTEPTEMWLSAKDAPQPTWIQFEFDGVSKLDGMRVWNYNQLLESLLGFGVRDVTIECSPDGADWAALGDFVFEQAASDPTYTGEWIDLSGIVAKCVRLAIHNNWGGIAEQYGLSEVQFLRVPTRAWDLKNEGADAEVVLTWRAGREAAYHRIYFSTDEQAVADGTAWTQTVEDNRLDLGTLELGTTYYCRVDEVNEAAVPSVWEGDVWSFTTSEYLVVDDFESYTDDIEAEETIWQAWIDGQTTEQSGSTVGYWDAPFAERTIVHGGRQSMPFEYNNVDTPFYSEAELEISPAQNWTSNGADTLSLWVRGNPISFVESASGGITMSGGGADIWDVADEFRFACKSLTGNGSIVAKIESLGNTDVWAKAAIMIRDSLDPGAKNATAYVTADGRVGWQFRLLDAGTSDSTRSEPAAITLPHWLRLTRTGNTIKAEHSSNGVAWEPMTEAANPTEPTARDIVMNSTVYIGLAVTSHNVDAVTTAQFSDVVTTGTVTGVWQAHEIGVSQPVNDPAEFYVTIQDGAGKTATVTEPTLVTASDWTQWKIPLSSLTGVNTAAVRKLILGVDSRNSAVKGHGMIYIDDIGFGHPAE